jgi:hypothetical protein
VLLKIVRLLGRRIQILQRRTVEVTAGCVTVALLATLFRFDLHLVTGPANFLIASVFALIGALITILSKSMRDVVTEPVSKPSGVKKWIDLYASADPVPNGATRTSKDGPNQSKRIWNRASLLTDHTSYWENLDEFVLRVVSECAQTAGSSWATMIASNTDDIDDRAAWRVGFLWPARWICRIIWIFLLLFFWKQFGDDLAGIIHAPTWLPEAAHSVLRFGILGLVLMAVATGVSRMIFLPWTLWVRWEQRIAISGKAFRRPEDTNWLGPFLMWYLVWTLGLVAVRVVDLRVITPPEIIRGFFRDFSGDAPVLGVAAALTCVVLAWRLPKHYPQTSGPAL